MKKIRACLIVLFAFLCAYALCGCGVNNDKQEEMFNYLKDNAYIDVGNRGYNDYDEERVVNQSPIPVNYHYFDFVEGDTTYTVKYDRKTPEENKVVYEVELTIKTEGKSDCTIYWFEENSKTKKLEYTGTK